MQAAHSEINRRTELTNNVQARLERQVTTT